MIQNEKFKLIGFNTKEGELPLWTDIRCKNAKQITFKKKELFVDYFGIQLIQLLHTKNHLKI